MGGDLPGFFGVLHTWSRQLQYHPHIHYVVPSGVINTDDGSWRPSGDHFFLPVMALSTTFCAKVRDRLKKAGLLDAVPTAVWTQPWNVNSQAVGISTASIKYLAPYVFRVAISDHRIVKVENGRVFFRYRKPHSNRERTMAVAAMEFLRRFLQHVLPSGFMKVRYFGFLSQNAAVSREEAGENRTRLRFRCTGTAAQTATKTRHHLPRLRQSGALPVPDIPATTEVAGTVGIAFAKSSQLYQIAAPRFSNNGDGAGQVRLVIGTAAMTGAGDNRNGRLATSITPFRSRFRMS